MNEKSKKCKSILYCGPGHQSKIHCEMKGSHTVHRAWDTPFGYVEWRKMEACTDYFDIPKTVKWRKNDK